MNIGILKVFPSVSSSSEGVLSEFVSCLSKKGHQVTLIDGMSKEEQHLTSFEYLIIATFPENLFGGRISERVHECLSQGGHISGKKGCALILKKRFSLNKACKALMSIMEKEGMILDYSNILDSVEKAQTISSLF